MCVCGEQGEEMNRRRQREYVGVAAVFVGLVDLQVSSCGTVA